jgi:hypothetical protein
MLHPSVLVHNKEKSEGVGLGKYNLTVSFPERLLNFSFLEHVNLVSHLIFSMTGGLKDQ